MLGAGEVSQPPASSTAGQTGLVGVSQRKKGRLAESPSPALLLLWNAAAGAIAAVPLLCPQTGRPHRHRFLRVVSQGFS